MTVKICIADDHELFRDGIANLIEKQADMVVVGVAGDGLEILSLAKSQAPDLILMDINMPISDGIEATRMLRKMMPDVIIVMLTAMSDDEKLVEAIKAGANGYILKSSSSQEFLNGIRGALSGETILPLKLAKRLIQEYVELASQQELRSTKLGMPTITFREIEILKQLAEGASNQEISNRLNISLYTVKSHVRSILEKLGAANRWEAVVIARKYRLIENAPSPPNPPKN